MIKAIIFDMGGVIIKHREGVADEIISELFNSSPTALQLFKEHHVSLSKGAIAFEEFISLLKINQSSSLSIEELLQKWKDLYTKRAGEIDMEVIELIEKLKKKYNVYLFTDTISIHDEINKTRGIYERFHKVFKSHEEGVSKKESKEAFVYILNKIDEKADECVFIDDKIGNVQHANEAGIHGVVYKNPEQLKSDLKGFGIDTTCVKLLFLI